MLLFLRNSADGAFRFITESTLQQIDQVRLSATAEGVQVAFMSAVWSSTIMDSHVNVFELHLLPGKTTAVHQVSALVGWDIS